jgi:kynureninase
MGAPDEKWTLEYAKQLDNEDKLRHLRDQFSIPTKADLKRQTIAATENKTDSEPCIYFCGNSLGIQPKRTREFVDKTLETWRTKGVHGHFKRYDDAVVKPWTQMDEPCLEPLAKLVGAKKHEVAVMQTLTANLHFLMASFYRPTKQRHKIILEGKAFPSDHYAVESQLYHHGLSPADSMILIDNPPKSTYLPTSHIIETIKQHADSTALVLLPGVQFYTGQLLDIHAITAAARAAGIPFIGWDLAHAIGNVELDLHGTDVDFAAWCHYKYLNAGPGAIAGLFVHEKHHSKVSLSEPATNGDHDSKTSSSTKSGAPWTQRLLGWWGNDLSTRFHMTNQFEPSVGAAGWQLSNPSALDISSLLASLDVFEQTDIASLRAKSVRLTGYLEQLLHQLVLDIRDVSVGGGGVAPIFEIITPSTPEDRGAQLSVKLRPGLLDHVMAHLDEEGVVLDERKPDVIRVAPAPLYNTFEEVWRFVRILKDALESAVASRELN